ncbi:MAG: lamin tail domain-containing protein, partial [Methanomassiliicoccaceae archaeon]|nr:lamin tail domain-containing protein [Methanomassiliicoccaceae archaeon]
MYRKHALHEMRKGQMPFAMIAVTLLILTGVYGVVTAEIERTKDNMDTMHDELNSVGNAVDSVKASLERGMGEIILDMGREKSTGNLDERFTTFDDRFDKWMNFQFPMRAAGAVVSIVDHDIELSVGTLKNAGGTDGAGLSSFRADGSVVVNISTSSGNVVREMYVSADGMSALPLLLENVSQFDAAITGPWSLITELMTYQLSSLAQYRVMSGYGAMSEYGAKGTNAIITDEDVRLAYRIALSIAETTYLRTTSDDNDMSSYEYVDAAELITFRNGYVDIDMGAVFAQTIAGIADDLVLGWLDYFMFTKILDIFDAIDDFFKDAVDWIFKLFTGSEAETAQKYLSKTMSNNGIPESEYRRALTGRSVSLSIPSAERTLDDVGENVITIPETTVSIKFPDVDILNWNGWNGFMSKYRLEHNQIREALRGTINSMIVDLADTYKLKTVRVACDPFDAKDFMTSLTDAMNTALDAQRTAVENCMESTIRSGKVIDTLYVTIYEHMAANRDSLFGVNIFKDSIRATVRNSVIESVKGQYGMPLDPTTIDSITDELMMSENVIWRLNMYDEYVDGRMSVFSDVLNSVEKNTNSPFKDLMVYLMRYGMDTFGLYPKIQSKTVSLVNEMAEFASLNPMSGVYGLPGTDSFTLTGNNGTAVKEYISADCDVDLKIKITPPTKNKENIHYVGFREDKEASYSSMFRIDVSAVVGYEARSSSPLMKMLDSYDAAVIGISRSNFDLAVPVMSGWGLTGVEYKPSTTILNDVTKAFLIFIEPLLGPLNELMKLAKNIVNVMANAVMRVANFVNDMLMKLYELIMEPLRKLAEIINNALEKVFSEILTTMVIKLGSQTFGIDLFGMRLEIITDIAGELRKGTSITKLRLTLPLFGVMMSATLDVKKDKEKELSFSGTIAAVAETWNLSVTVDPLMKIRKHLIEIDGTFRGTDIHAVIPDIVQYDELEFRLSDVPGVGQLLSNIPLPIPGMKGSLDAGFELKYSLPYVYGVVINEFELNPAGADNDKEWVEIYNSTLTSVDLEGYRLATLSGKSYEIGKITLKPGERTVITFPGQFLNNSKESVTLYNADGIVVDSTPMKSDAKDNDFTWQRETDASATWVFKKQTKGADNGGKYVGGNPVKAMLAQCVMSAATQAFSEMGMQLVGPDGVADFVKRTIELTIEKAIEMIASCVVSASIFIEIALNDLSGSLHSGIRFSLMLGREIVQDGLNWAVGQIKGMMNNIDNPTGMTPRQIISDDIYFQTMVFAQVTTPKILGTLGGKANVTAGLVVNCNITAMCNLLGRPGGTWKVNIG